jgi:signal transduction histidine kinase
MDPGSMRRDPGGSASAAADLLLAERLRFTGITKQDVALLAELRPTFEREADRFVEAFYDHLRSSAVLRPLLADPAVIERLKQAQREYLLSLISGRYDLAYVERRLAIGRVHARIGLAPQWYLGSYSLYHDLLMPHVHAHHAGNPASGIRAAAALDKLLVFDMQLVLDAYYERREQEALERSKQLAAVGEMAASIAHEVRNPLAGMRGAIEVLRRRPQLDRDSLFVLDEVVSQIGRLEGLVRDLLDFASPRPSVPRSFDLQALLERLLATYREQADAAGIGVVCDWARDARHIAADPHQMEQVFLNLLQNAVQAMDGGGTLAVRTAANENETVVIVADTGRGIHPDVLPQIFQPFFTTKHRGSGLGLAIVHKILVAHGGTIEVQTKLSRGTTVTVHLPNKTEP